MRLRPDRGLHAFRLLLGTVAGTPLTSRPTEDWYVIILKTLGFFILTAIAEIANCHLPCVWLRKSGSAWLLIPAAVSLASFA